jgi:hypothetical protein
MFERWLLRKWLRELQLNVDGLRKMADDYRREGGFREVSETLEKLKAGDVFPKDLLERGRQAELKFADACAELAECYQQLLDFVKKAAGVS